MVVSSKKMEVLGILSIVWQTIRVVQGTLYKMKIIIMESRVACSSVFRWEVQGIEMVFCGVRSVVMMIFFFWLVFRVRRISIKKRNIIVTGIMIVVMLQIRTYIRWFRELFQISVQVDMVQMLVILVIVNIGTLVIIAWVQMYIISLRDLALDIFFFSGQRIEQYL